MEKGGEGKVGRTETVLEFDCLNTVNKEEMSLTECRTWYTL